MREMLQSLNSQRQIDITSRISNQPNQGVIDRLNTENQLKCWQYWLDLLQTDQNQDLPNSFIETGSTVAGFNQTYNRWKTTGEYCIEDIKNILVKDLEEFNLEESNKDMRICARIFVPIPKNMSKRDFENEIKSISELSNYSIEYAYYSQNNQKKEGLIILFGKNEENRKIRKSTLTTKELQDYSNKIEAESGQLRRNFSDKPDKTDFTEINSRNLTELQKIQLTYFWKKFFGPGYDLSNVDKILKNPDIIITILADQKGNVVAACTGEIDNLGGIEITEFFAKMTFNTSKTSEFMLRLMIEKCQKEYPNLQIYMEANMSSAMPFIAIKCGLIIPKLKCLLIEQVATANVKVDNFSENSYNNFALLVYP